jgi:hypothetical protein
MAEWPSRVARAAQIVCARVQRADRSIAQGAFERFPAAGFLAAVSLLLAGGSAFAQTSQPQGPQDKGTIGLVIGGWRFGLFETENAKQECPEGFQFKQSQNYAAQFPTPEARQAQGERFGYYVNRGPNGENVFYFPTVVKDPLPFRPAQGPTAIGLDLDGEQQGRGAAQSLPHGNFTSPDGRRGIDNQLYRVIGCTPGWRKGGMIEGIVSQYMRSETQARLLLEITDVDDERNDDHVTITTYRGRDPVAADSKGALIPWLSQRIDYKGGARYVQRLSGRIVDGVLITDPMDVRLPYYEQPDMAGDRDIKKMRLEIKLTRDGADGLLGGYVDLDNWYLTYAKTWGAHAIADIEGWSAPATYQALHEFADYRDPKTGQVTGISAAYQVSFARTYIIHSPKGDAAVAPRLAPKADPRALASR